MSADLIRVIVKKRYETGAYGNTHFEMRREDLDTFPREPRRSDFPIPPAPLGDLLSIPIVIDDALADGQWRLVDNTTNEILFTGTLESAKPPG